MTGGCARPSSAPSIATASWRRSSSAATRWPPGSPAPARGRARALLARAGYPGGRGLPPIAVWSSVKGDDILREHERIRKDLEAVGVRTEFHYQTDWPVFSKLMAEQRLPVFLRAWFADVPDPENFLFKLFYSKSPRNYVGYASAAVDALLVQAR